ncbi:hypothetical protein BH23PAT2_BH23PAT2_04780 [soil metagenome]
MHMNKDTSQQPQAPSPSLVQDVTPPQSSPAFQGPVSSRTPSTPPEPTQQTVAQPPQSITDQIAIQDGVVVPAPPVEADAQAENQLSSPASTTQDNKVQPAMSTEAPREQPSEDSPDNEGATTSTIPPKPPKPPKTHTTNPIITIALAGIVGISLMGLVVMAYVQQDSEEPANSSSAEETSISTDQASQKTAPTDAFSEDVTTLDEGIDALEADLDQFDQELSEVEGTR